MNAACLLSCLAALDWARVIGGFLECGRDAAGLTIFSLCFIDSQQKWESCCPIHSNKSKLQNYRRRRASILPQSRLPVPGLRSFYCLHSGAPPSHPQGPKRNAPPQLQHKQKTPLQTRQVTARSRRHLAGQLRATTAHSSPCTGSNRRWRRASNIGTAPAGTALLCCCTQETPARPQHKVSRGCTGCATPPSQGCSATPSWLAAENAGCPQRPP